MGFSLINNAALSAHILLAQAAPAAPNPVGTLGSLIPLLLMFAVIYFLLLRPANKQRTEHKQLLDALKKGDEVVTSSGLWGRVVTIEENVVYLEIADKIKVRILRDRIAGPWAPARTQQKK